MSDQDRASSLKIPGRFSPAGKLKIPAPGQDQGLPGSGEAYIPNTYAGHERLTPREAVDQINFLSAALLADGRKRNGSG
jgi:hypothetical protein